MALKKQAANKAAGNNKRGPKAKQVVEEKPAEEVESSDADSDADEEENGVNLNDGSNSEEEGAAADFVDSEAEESEDDDDDDDEMEPGEVSVSKGVAQEESDDDDNDEEADSDDEPVEAPIGKKAKETTEPKKGGIPKVAVARIPQDTPKEQILFITNLPKEYKHLDLVALFTKFGPITVVNRIKTKAGGNNVQMAFESAEAVDAALAAKGKALTLNGQVLNVARPLNKDDLNVRTVAVGLIGPNATKDEIKAHFKSCGAIESVNFSHNKMMPTAYVRFEEVSSIPKAVKLNGSDFNSRFITVREEAYKNKSLKAPNLTLTVANTGNHESFKSDTIEKIFKKHGEILDIDIVCTRAILAFVTYKTADDATKAFSKLNGKTISDLEIKLDNYHTSSSVRTILVTNLHPSVDEQQLNEVFSDVDSIKMLGYKALVKFTTDDAFCKSFLLNELVVQGQPIFLEPNSSLKYKIMQNKGKHHAGGPPAGGKFNNGGNNKNFTQKPFNKRSAQGNGSTHQSFKKARRA